jgi:NiFe hydrogenase small subunit HydA
MVNVLWLEAQGCGGDNISMLNSEQPDIITLLKNFDINLLWHPNLSSEMGNKAIQILKDILSEKISLDILIVSGATPLGPNNTGRYFLFHGTPIREWILKMARLSQFTLAVGTCASFGGISSARNNPTDAVGLQFLHDTKGGLLGADYLSKKGLPVINIPGCPSHPDWIVETLIMILSDRMTKELLDTYNRPKVFFSYLAHHGCPRNEYYEFKSSAVEYGQCGCLFENLGCKGTRCRF